MIGISIKKVYTLIGATSHSAEERQKDDYYATEPKAVESLLKVENFNNYILEPCCGSGHISKVLKNYGFNVTSEELFDRGYGNIGVDYWRKFFDESPPVRIPVFSERILCSKNGEFKPNESKAVCYAWFIWEKGFKGKPKLDWI